MSPKPSKQICSVFGCSNTAEKTQALGKFVHFYLFPSKPWEKQRREDWIRFARRINNDGTPWTPKKYSRLCSEHFIGGKKSDHPHHPDYIPTVSGKGQTNNPNGQKISRFKRAMKRSVLKQIQPSQKLQQVCIPNEEVTKSGEVEITNFEERNSKSQTAEKCTQVRPEMIVASQPHFRPIISKVPHFRGYASVRGDSQALHALTSVTLQVFELLLTILPRVPQRTDALSMEDKLLMTLMKLKSGAGLSFTTLAVIFDISMTSVANNIYFIINALYEATKTWIHFPCKEAVAETMPNAFKEQYPNCRVIIDCTEMKVETPKLVDQKIHLYSNYKGCFTAKYLIGITPGGLISFISKGYGGRATDSYITNECGLLNLLEPGDMVMADKGFPNININDDAVLVMPPFSTGKDKQFSMSEVESTYNIASLRIHVERSIQFSKY